MALNWNVEKIKDYENVCWIGEKGSIDRKMNPLTETLIFGTMGVGIGQITDKNVDEFAARFRILEKIHGAFLYKPNKDGKGKTDWFVSDEEFIAHIGLWCNVTNETRVRWVGRTFSNKATSVTEELARTFRHNRSKLEVEA